MTNYWLGTAALLLLFLLFVLLPLWRFKSKDAELDKQKAVSNPEIIKQRLSELSGEKDENLLSESDYEEAIKETKLQLADELNKSKSQVGKAGLMAWGLAPACIIVSAFVFYKVNQVEQVQNWEVVSEKLPGLGQRIVVQGDSSVTRQELVDFALGLRTKLNTEKEDPVGWLLLGRVLSSLNDFEGALGAFQKSLKLDPNRTGAIFSYAQTLLMTEDMSNVRTAKKMLLRLRSMTPEDTNVLGLMAVTHTRLDEKESALAIWKELKNRTSPDSRMLTTIEQQIAMLSGNPVPQSQVVDSALTDNNTKLLVNVALAQSMIDKLPGYGYLFVFVQDADSPMKMPAAVKKQALADLDFNQPVSLVLSNADAMLQEFNLSNLKNGRLIARVSKDENVAVQPGELQGEVIIPIKQGVRTEHSLTIDKELL